MRVCEVCHLPFSLPGLRRRRVHRHADAGAAGAPRHVHPHGAAPVPRDAAPASRTHHPGNDTMR